MRTIDQADLGRELFNFPAIVSERFAFLRDFGFARAHSLPTLVSYRKAEVEVNVFHGRRSFEVGFEILRAGKRYSMSQLIRLTDEEAGAQYRRSMATTPTLLIPAVERLAELVRRYAVPILQGDAEIFATLDKQAEILRRNFDLDTVARQTRPEAESAFREHRYREAAELYERMSDRLTPAERKKLEFARRHS